MRSSRVMSGISYSGQVETRPSPVIISCHLFPLSRFHNYPSGVNFPSFLSPSPSFSMVCPPLLWRWVFLTRSQQHNPQKALKENKTTKRKKRERERERKRHFDIFLRVSSYSLSLSRLGHSLMATGSASANKRALIGLISLLFCFVCLRSPYTRYAHSRQWLLLQLQ